MKTYTYQIKVDKVDPTTGAVLTANVVNTTPTNVPSGNPANIVGVSLNTKSSPIGYFFSNTGTFQITYTVTNACGSTNQTGYFNEDGSCRIGQEDVVVVDGKAYPNPTNGLTTINYISPRETNIKVTVSPVQGNSAYTVSSNEHASTGINTTSFDTANLPAGMYIYQISDDNSTIQTGKIVVTK